MTTTAIPLASASRAPFRRRPWPRLVGAEFLKLRRRRGLLALTVALTVLPVLIGFGVTETLHQLNPDQHGPGGGLQNFQGATDMLARLSIIGAMLVGVTTGAGDLAAGVFRELIMTGRSRTALFAARIPAGLALLLPLVVAAVGLGGLCAIALSGSLPAPSALDIVVAGTWVLLGATLGFALGLGVASVIGSRAASITILLAFQFAISPLLVLAGFLGATRAAVPVAALERLKPGVLEADPTLSMSLGAALISVAAWTAVSLCLGAWRTATRTD